MAMKQWGLGFKGNNAIELDVQCIAHVRMILVVRIQLIGG
jgi:hypothetical protein